jgi:glycosyltransferase involved in cell wall biosynthesis
LRNPGYKKLIFWALREADEVNALTRYLIDNLKKAGFERKDFKTIPWGIDTMLFPFQEKSIQSPIRFLHIANLSPVKDQETLLRAFKKISSAISSELLIIGVGTSESRVKNLIAELRLDDNVRIIGLVPYKELHSYYHRADILLHTSLSEGQSEVVTEAMTCGVVVCGTKVGLLYDLPDSCVSVNVRDHNALAEETLKLIDDPVRLTGIRLHAYAWAKDHSILWTVDRIKECYKS